MMKDFAKKNVTKAEWFFSKEEKNDNKIRNPFFSLFSPPPCDDAYSQKKSERERKIK